MGDIRNEKTMGISIVASETNAVPPAHISAGQVGFVINPHVVLACLGAECNQSFVGGRGLGNVIHVSMGRIIIL